MKLKKIHSYLVHPAKSADEQPEIGGTRVPRAGQLHEMLASIYERAPTECDIDIVFLNDDEGRQRNPTRDLLVDYVAAPTLSNGRTVSRLLQGVTTHRSGLGLLFFMVGDDGERSRLVISRFPADQGIIAEENRQDLSVEFIERVFMKNAKSYKSVCYESDSTARGFWDGRAVDRQISGPKEVSDYWIREFLTSELRTTGPAGTKRLAVALRSAIKATDDLPVRQELVAAATLIRGRDGETVTGRALVDQLGISDEASEALERHFSRVELMDETFMFDGDEFDRHLMYRTVELDNGGMLTAEDRTFDQVFERSDAQDDEVRFATEGRIVDERLRRSR